MPIGAEVRLADRALSSDVLSEPIAIGRRVGSRWLLSGVYEVKAGELHVSMRVIDTASRELKSIRDRMRGAHSKIVRKLESYMGALPKRVVKLPADAEAVKAYIAQHCD